MFEDTLLSRTFAYPIVQSACNVFSNWCIWCSKSIEEISKLELIEWLKGHPFDTGGVRCGLGGYVSQQCMHEEHFSQGYYLSRSITLLFSF